MFEMITAWDRDVLLWIQENLRADILNLPVIFITSLGNAGLIWIVSALVMLGPRKTRKAGFLALCSLLVGFLITNLILKNAVARIRPYDAWPAIELLICPESDYSFPSGHATSSFAAAVIYYRYLPKPFGMAACVLAALIALSRLYVGVHYPTDVICGVMIGIGAACLIIRLKERYIRDGAFPYIFL